MIKLNIRNINNEIISSPMFDTIEQKDLWLQDQLSYNAFGLPERQELNEFGEPTGITLPAEYTVETVDISAEIAQQATNEAARKYLSETDWYMIREIETNVTMPEEIRTARANARASIV